MLELKRCKWICPQKLYKLAVVVAQLADRSLPIPEVRGSNPVISESLLRAYEL